MKPRAFAYVLRQAVANIRNNPMVHGVGMVTMVVSLLILGAFLLLYVNVQAFIEQWGRSLNMSVYLADGITEARVQDIRRFVQEIPGAEVRAFISKEEALKDFRDALGPKARLLDALSENPLPASLEVIFRDPGGLPDPGKTKERLEAMEGVREVEYSQEWIRRFEGVMEVVGISGFVIGGFLCLGVLFIVTNTIKLTLYNRKEEIEILQLVGATDGFIKAPFLLEGGLQGAASGIVAMVLIYAGCAVLSWKPLLLFGTVPVDLVSIPYSYAVLIVLISVLFGLIGSLIAVGRFFDL